MVYTLLNKTPDKPSLIQQILEIDEDYEETLQYISQQLVKGEITQKRFEDLYSILLIQSRIDEEDAEESFWFYIDSQPTIFTP